MHVRWNYCNMETLHLVDVYIYIHCVIGKQCSVLDTWLSSVAPHCGHLSRQGRWQQNTESGGQTCELWFCNEVGKPNGTSYLDRSPVLHKSPRSILGEAELSPLILSPDSVSIRVNHFHLKRINRSPIIWHFKSLLDLKRPNIIPIYLGNNAEWIV